MDVREELEGKEAGEILINAKQFGPLCFLISNNSAITEIDEFSELPRVNSNSVSSSSGEMTKIDYFQKSKNPIRAHKNGLFSPLSTSGSPLSIY